MNADTVGLTSKMSAAARAYESDRHDRLFVDRLAHIYANLNDDESRDDMNQVGNEPNANDGEKSCCCGNISCRTKIMNALLNCRCLLNSGIGRLIGINVRQIYLDISVRTRFMDDIIEKNTVNVKQIVLLACGGDFRPYRLSFLNLMASSSDLTFYLLDVPHVLKYRRMCFEKLDEQPTTLCKVIEIPADLSKPDWSRLLREAGFIVDLPTLWIAEGFFHYLTEQQITLLFNRIRNLSSSIKTFVAFDLVSTRFQTSARRATDTGLFHFAVDDETEVHKIFSSLGCRDIRCTSFQDLGRSYTRNVSHDRSFIVEAKIIPRET